MAAGYQRPRIIAGPRIMTLIATSKSTRTSRSVPSPPICGLRCMLTPRRGKLESRSVQSRTCDRRDLIRHGAARSGVLADERQGLVLEHRFDREPGGRWVEAVPGGEIGRVGKDRVDV